MFSIRSIYLCVALGFSVLVSTAVFADGDGAINSRPKIICSIRPLAILTQDLLGDLADVDVLLPGNMDPHNASLRFSDRQRLAKADLVIWFGPELERFLAKAAASIQEKNQLRIEDVAGIDWLTSQANTAHDHDHGNESPNGKDMHVWLSVQNSKLIVTALRERLSTMYPALEKSLAVNAQQLMQQLDTADGALKTQLLPYQKKTFGVYHDGFGHFVKQYGLHQIAAVNQMPEQALSAKKIAEFSMQMRGASCLLVERHGNSPQRLADQLNVKLVLADPLASDIAIIHYVDFLMVLGQAFEECFEE